MASKGLLVAILVGALSLAPVVAAAGTPRSTLGESLPVPALPFPSRNDPSLCGIPQPLGKGVTGVLDGHYHGKLVEPTVYLYDSHLRTAVTGEAPSGTRVQVLYYQSNPSLDYYMVRVTTASGSFDGWVPAPFLRDVSTR
jgi:hypothetical protein